MPKPHIAIVNTAHAADDIRMFTRWVRSFNAAGWRVSLIAPLRGTRPALPEGVEFREIDFYRGYLKRLMNAKRVVPHLNDLQPDFIMFPDPEAFPLLLGYGRRRKCRVIFDRHENFEQADTLTTGNSLGKLIAQAYAKFEWRSAPRLDGVIVVLEEMLDNLNPAANTVVAHNFPTQAVIEQLAGEPEPGTRSYTCVNLGAVHVSRGVYEQLELARVMVKDRGRQDFSFIIGGHFDQGSLPHCEAFVERHGLKENVTLQKTRLEHRQVINYYRSARIGFSPYLNNPKAAITLQNKILEFMGAGLPVITSPSSANGRIVEAAGCGALFWADEVPAIADTIEHWMDHPAEAAELGSLGRQYMLANCTWEVDFAKVEAWLLEMSVTS